MIWKVNGWIQINNENMGIETKTLSSSCCNFL